MTRMLKFKGLALLLGIIWLATLGILTVVRANEDNGTPVLRGRIVAVNIPGASAISAVGTFLPGGPIHDKPAFAAFTQPGKILDPTRILVGSSSNFGAPRANAGQREGSFLSIETLSAFLLTTPSDGCGPQTLPLAWKASARRRFSTPLELDWPMRPIRQPAVYTPTA